MNNSKPTVLSVVRIDDHRFDGRQRLLRKAVRLKTEEMSVTPGMTYTVVKKSAGGAQAPKGWSLLLTVLKERSGHMY